MKNIQNKSLLELKKYKEIKISDPIRTMFDTTPMCIDYWNKNYEIIDCNTYAMEFYGFTDKDEYLRPDPLSLPDFQENGEPSLLSRNKNLETIFRDGYSKFEFEERKLNGDIIYLETEGIRVKDGDEFLVITYSKDVTHIKEYQRAVKKAQDKLKYHEKLLIGVNRLAELLLVADESSRINILEKGMQITGRLLNSARVQIWVLKQVNGEPCFAVEYNWASEPDKQIAEEGTEFIYPYRKNKEFFDNTLSACNSINGSISLLPREMMEYYNYFEVLSIAMLPMFIDSELFGFLAVCDCINERVFTNDEISVLTSAGRMFASVFKHNMQRELAYTDALTGIRNRRYLLENAEDELQACKDENLDFSLILIDIDFFKIINDTYGHAIGDEVLQIFTSRVKNVIKNDTLFTRYGGEEFVITLPNINTENAKKIAERIRRTIAETLFNTTQGEFKVTASLGIASKESITCTFFEILNAADSALYKSKESGRNVVMG